MFLKCATAIIIAALTGAFLLGLRQQRFETMHNMAKIHSGMNSTRQTMWNLQTRIAAQIQPVRLQEAIVKANLPFETFTPSNPVQSQLVSNQKNVGFNLLKTAPSDIDLADGQMPLEKPDKTTTTVSQKPSVKPVAKPVATTRKNASINRAVKTAPIAKPARLSISRGQSRQ